MLTTFFTLSVIIISFLLILHASLSLWQMLFAWSNPKQIKRNNLPNHNFSPSVRFSLIIPALNEAGVIRETLGQLARQTYNMKFFEVLVVLYKKDKATIKQVRLAKESLPNLQIRTLLYNHKPKGKPQSLNFALPRVKGDYVAVFDAEDHIHPDFLNVMNSLIIKRGRKVYQTGVSLVNFNSGWYAFHNVVEYYFWFRSRLPWYASQQFVPLGGAGVLFPIEVLHDVGGWDESCLTEDAKIGIDISVAGYSFEIFSNESLDTQEEAPTSLQNFVRQRTRWIQGFLQIIKSGSWRKLTIQKQFHFFSFFLFPIIKIFLLAWLLISLLFVPKLHILVVLISFIPFSLLVFQIVIQLVGIYEMLQSRGKTKMFPWAVVLFISTYLPYDLLISYCALRATSRLLSKNNVWEKTIHQNLHREGLTYQKYGLSV